MNFNFILPIRVGSTVESLKEGEKLVEEIALLIKGDVVKDSVNI